MEWARRIRRIHPRQCRRGRGARVRGCGAREAPTCRKGGSGAHAHVALITDASDSQLSFKRAKRWALESELRFESLSEAVDRCRLQAATEGSEWAGQAADEAVAAWRLARNAARGAHEIAQVPVPPLLQDPDPDEVPATQEQAASPPSGSARVLETGVSAASGGSTVQRGSAISAPTYRIVDMQLVEITTTKDGEESAKLVLGLDARIVEMEYLEAQDESFDIDLPKLMGARGNCRTEGGESSCAQATFSGNNRLHASRHRGGIHAAANRCARLPRLWLGRIVAWSARLRLTPFRNSKVA